MRLEIVKAGINGEGIGFHSRKPAFIDGCFPGELVECELKDEGRYWRGKLTKILKKSPERIKSPCIHSRNCGACPLMALNYEEQLKIKKQLLEGALYKYCSFDEPLENIIASERIYEYRNKCNLPVFEKDGKLVNALYRQDSNHPTIIQHCLIHKDMVEKIRLAILDVLNRHHLRAYDRHEKAGIRQLIVRAFDDSAQAILVTGKGSLPEEVIEDLKKIEGLTSLFQGVNTVRNPVQLMPEKLKPLFGPGKIEMKVGPYRLKLSPQAFFQLNRKQAERIYEDVSDLIKDRKKLIIEAYCGIGAISLFLHDKAEKIIGIEVIEKAVKDAEENARLNQIGNAHFLCGDASETVRKILKKEKVDLLIVDPPRTGLDEELIATILKSKLKEIIYISCNPATLGKDLHLLSKKYEIRSIQGYDMFPNTPHVETVCLLYHQKKDFISVPYEPADNSYLKKLE